MRKQVRLKPYSEQLLEELLESMPSIISCNSFDHRKHGGSFHSIHAMCPQLHRFFNVKKKAEAYLAAVNAVCEHRATRHNSAEQQEECQRCGKLVGPSKE